MEWRCDVIYLGDGVVGTQEAWKERRAGGPGYFSP